MSEKSKHLDRYDRIDSKEKRLLLNGTTLSVKSRAQVLRQSIFVRPSREILNLLCLCHE